MPRSSYTNIHPGRFANIPSDVLDVPLDIRPGVITEDLHGFLSPVHSLSLREIEGLLGMTSEVPLVEHLTDLVLNATDIEQNPFITTQRLGLLFEVLDPSCYIPERSLSHVYPSIEVDLKDKANFIKAIDLISSFKYVKWRLSSPRYWRGNCISVEGVFKK